MIPVVYLLKAICRSFSRGYAKQDMNLSTMLVVNMAILGLALIITLYSLALSYSVRL